MVWQNESLLFQASITAKRGPQMICELLYIDYSCTTSVGFNVHRPWKGGRDRWCPNSSLIDFNGEILISIWPRPAVRGQSHLLGRAGHPACTEQSIIFGTAGEILNRSTLDSQSGIKMQPGDLQAHSPCIRMHTHKHSKRERVFFWKWACKALLMIRHVYWGEPRRIRADMK